jgi:hypothetical protein
MTDDDQPTAPNMRSFALNDPAFHASFGSSSSAWIPNGALPPEPRWARAQPSLSVAAEDGLAASDAVGEWLRHLAAGRIGSEHQD